MTVFPEKSLKIYLTPPPRIRLPPPRKWFGGKSRGGTMPPLPPHLSRPWFCHNFCLPQFYTAILHGGEENIIIVLRFLPIIYIYKKYVVINTCICMCDMKLKFVTKMLCICSIMQTLLYWYDKHRRIQGKNL